MKKNILALVLSGVLLASLGLSSCENISLQNFMPKSVIGAQLNDKGELVLTYSDNTTQNLGLVKGEDGKDGADGIDGKDGIDGIDGKDGEDLVACIHAYGDWQTQLSPTCTSIGYETRTCSLCGDLDYEFTQALGHTYENPINIIGLPCQQSWGNKTCTSCGDTILVEQPASEEHLYSDWETVEEYACGASKQQRVCLICNEKQLQTLNFSAHTFDENTLCTTCGHQEFIESEEYIEDIIIPPQTIHFGQSVLGIIWWNKDKTYGLKISLGNPSYLFLLGYVGTPVHVRLPAYYNEAPLGTIGFSADEPEIFKNCTTLKSIYIPDTVTRIEDYAFDGCTNLESVRFSENLKQIGAGAFRNCTSLEILYFKDNNSNLSHTFDYRYDPTFENCLSLTEIYFPLSYDMSGSTNEFSSCTALKKIYVSQEFYEIYIKRFKDFPTDLEIIIYQ